MSKPIFMTATLAIAAALFALPFIHRAAFPLDEQYRYGIERANEDVLVPTITATISQGERNDGITCEGNRGTKVLLQPYTLFMIPQRMVFVCANIVESGMVEGINRAGHLK